MAVKKKRRGAKLKLNKKLIDKAATLIRGGAYAKNACLYVRIGETTYYKWLELGKKDLDNNVTNSLYAKFWESIKRAELEAEFVAIQGIRKAGRDGNWQAWAWYLERKHFDKWGNKQKIEHCGKIDVDPKSLTREQLDAIAAIDLNDKNIESKIHAIVNSTSTISRGTKEKE